MSIDFSVLCPLAYTVVLIQQNGKDAICASNHKTQEKNNCHVCYHTYLLLALTTTEKYEDIILSSNYEIKSIFKLQNDSSLLF